MAARIAVVTIDCHDAARLVAFWGAALGYAAREDVVGASLIDPAGRGPAIGFQAVPEPKVGKNRLHLDLVVTGGDWEAEVARLVGLGAQRVRRFDHDPRQSWWVMRDPKGNEFCVVHFRDAPHP